MITATESPPRHCLERRDTFSCFGSQCTVIVGSAADESARVALAAATASLRSWHGRFSRFLPDSEISALNADPRPAVPVSPLMRRIVEAALGAARLTEGLVDPTLLPELERAGYAAHLSVPPISLVQALRRAPVRAPAQPRRPGRWREIHVSRAAGLVIRPPGVRLDLGGIAKGVFADELGALLSGYERFVVDCAGDILLGGRSRTLRPVEVASPWDASVLHTFELGVGAVATSGIGERSWLSPDGKPAHHLLDPLSGRPAFTGLVQVTALAPTAAEAEARSKAALLSGPERVQSWLPHGGVFVLEDGSALVVLEDRTVRRLGT
jgi:thiamine biosynthesis lipoprotein